MPALPGTRRPPLSCRYSEAAAAVSRHSFLPRSFARPARAEGRALKVRPHARRAGHAGRHGPRLSQPDFPLEFAGVFTGKWSGPAVQVVQPGKIRLLWLYDITKGSGPSH